MLHANAQNLSEGIAVAMEKFIIGECNFSVPPSINVTQSLQNIDSKFID